MRLKVQKVKPLRKKDKPWLAELVEEADYGLDRIGINHDPAVILLVGYYCTWQEALENGLVAYNWYDARSTRDAMMRAQLC